MRTREAEAGRAGQARGAGLSWLPLGVALVPKCPMCVAAWLSAAGAGVGVTEAAPWVLRLGQVLALLVLGGLALRLGRRAHHARRYRPLAGYLAAVLTLVALAWAVPSLLWLRLVALAAVGLAASAAERVACGRCAAPPARSS
jgi:hypothetical protein